MRDNKEQILSGTHDWIFLACDDLNCLVLGEPVCLPSTMSWEEEATGLITIIMLEFLRFQNVSLYLKLQTYHVRGLFSGGDTYTPSDMIARARVRPGRISKQSSS
jgi:hypothetical protein